MIGCFKEAMMHFRAKFHKETEELICSRCKKNIMKDQAFIIVRGDIVMYNPNLKPTIFTCPEQAFNYAQRLVMHSLCWLDTLKEYDAELYDMDKVIEEYKKRKEIKDGLESK